MTYNKKTILLSALILLIVFLFAWWSNPSLIPKIAPDSYEYISIAKNFSDPSHEIRPFFYPMMIRFCMIIGGEHWGNILMGLQIILHCLTIVIMFHLYLTLNIPNYIAFIFSIVIGINPNLILYTTRLLPQQILGVLIGLTFYFSLKLIKMWDVEILFKNKNLYLIGVFSGLALVTKPSWMLGILPIISTIIYLKKISITTLKVVLILLILHFSFNFIWNQYKIKINNEPVYGISIINGERPNIFEKTIFFVQGQNITLAAIRLGLVEYAQGTPFYKRLKERDLLKLAGELNGIPDEKYMYIINSFTWDERNDTEFAQAILRNAPFQLLFGQLSTWHTFFTKRMFYPDDGFPGMPKIVKYLYVGSYSNLYRPFMPILLVIFLGLIRVKEYKPVVILIGLILLYFSLLHAIFTASPQHFIYYRTSVEYILFFAVLLPVAYLIEFLKTSIKQLI